MSIRRWLRTSSIVQCFACILLVAAASAQSTETTDVQEPQNNGVYYLSSEGWIPMQHVLAFAKGHQHVLRGVIPPFVMQQTIRFRGAEAPVKVNDLKPTFLLKGSVVAGGGSARDVVLVRLDQRGESRSLPVTTGKTIFSFRQTLPGDRVTDIVVNSKSPTVFTVVPKNNLASGEYLLTFGLGQVGGYDFQIVPTPAAQNATAESGSKNGRAQEASESAAARQP